MDYTSAPCISKNAYHLHHIYGPILPNSFSSSRLQRIHVDLSATYSFNVQTQVAQTETVNKQVPTCS